MKFNYQARTKEGQIQAGVVEAASREAALNLLRKYGFYVTLLEEISILPFYIKRITIFERISQKDIVLFSRQLSIMFKSEVPLVETLSTLARQTKNLSFKEKILALSEDVEGGTSFSKALARYPKVFSSFYISVIKSGEASGKLAEVLERLAGHLERDYHFRSKIRGAMIYPALIVFVVLVVLLLMVFFVIPNLSKILEETGQELPVIIQFMTNLSTFLKGWGWVLILIFLGLVLFILQYYRTLEGRKVFDKFFLKLPLIGEFLKIVYVSRFAENLSTLISGGLPISQSLEIAGEIVGHAVYKDIILKAKDEVQKGESISSILQEYPEIFPPIFVQMTLVGEKTGTLDKTLMGVVDFYKEEVDRTIDNLLSVLEPALIVFLGLIVAGLMASVLIPLYKIMVF